SGGRVELAVEGASMRLDGVQRDVELTGDVAQREVAREKPQDVQLALAQLLAGAYVTPGARLHLSSHVRGELGEKRRDRKGIEIGLRRFERHAGALDVGDAVTGERETQQRVRMPVARRRRGRNFGRTLELGNRRTELTLGNQRGTEGGAWVGGARMASPEAMLVQQFEGIAGEPLRLMNPFELKLAEGEIREHVRSRCGVLACSRQPSRLLEWNAC